MVRFKKILIDNFKFTFLIIISIGFLIRIITSLYFFIEGPYDNTLTDADVVRYHVKALLFYDMSFSLKYFSQLIIYLNDSTFLQETLPSIGYVYSILLSFFYKIFFPSILTGFYLSCVTWLLSCFVIFLIMKELNIKKIYMLIIIAVFSIMPSSIFLSSVTLKEIFQLFFFSLSIYFFIKLNREKKYLYLLMFLISLVLLSLFHRALIFVSVVFFYLSFLTLIKIKIYETKFIIITLFILIIMVASNNLYFDIDLFEEIKTFRYNQHISRTHYGFSIFKFSDSNIFFVIDNLVWIVFYFFRPFIFDVSTVQDLILFFENWFRILIILHSLYIIKKNYRKKNIDYLIIVVFFMCLITELLWAVGTLNWGTAARHHYVVTPILFISYAYLLGNKKFAITLKKKKGYWQKKN